MMAAAMLPAVCFSQERASDSAAAGEMARAVIFIGNSITYGAGLQDPETEAPPVRAVEFMSDELPDCRILYSNQGVSGSTTADFLPSEHRLYDSVVEAADRLSRETDGPVLFSIMLGTNDSAGSGPFGSPVSPERYEANMCSIIDSLLSRYPDSRVILHCPIWYSPNTHNGAVYLDSGLKRLKSYRPVIRHIVKSYSVRYPGRVCAGDVKGFPVFKRKSLEYLQPEQGYSGIFYLHPNVKGAAVLGRLWAEAILGMPE